MKNRIIKLLILLILPLVPYMGITNAQYYDLENSDGNSFSAGSLELELQDEYGGEYLGFFFDKEKLKVDEKISKIINIVKTGSVIFYYHPKFEFVGGKDSVCSELQIIAKKDGGEVYSGSLADFNLVATPVLITGNTDNWEFKLMHENENEVLQGEHCEFNIVFKASQNINQTGFSDTVKLSNIVGFAYEPTLTAYHNEALHKFVFALSNIANFTEFEYSLIYDTDSISDNANGVVELSGENTKIIQIDLGTESNGVITPHVNPHNFNLEINLLDIDGEAVILSEQIN